MRPNARRRCSRLWPAALLAAGALALSCGGDSSGGAGGVKLDDLPGLLAARLCVEVDGCFDKRSLYNLFGDAGCEARLKAQILDGDFQLTLDAVNAGRVRYDASQVDACLAEIKGLGCDFGTTRVLEKKACDAVFVGKAKRGDDCVVDTDCEGVAFCKRKSPASCPGACSALLGAGETCQRDGECEDGLNCGDDRTCAAPAKLDDACGGSIAGTCAAGLACIGEKKDQGLPGKCTETSQVFVKKIGESCDLDTGKLCEQGLACVVKVEAGKTSFSCQKPGASDSSCSFGVPSACPEDQYCDAALALGNVDGTCRDLPAAGEDCATVPGSPSCAAGLECDTDLKCHPVNRLGQPCMSDDGCASGRCVAANCERIASCEL